MIGRLPKSLDINGKSIPIRSDFRDCLIILQAFGDPELTDNEKAIVMLKCLYCEEIKDEYSQEAIDKGIWFLNCGDTIGKPQTDKPLYDFEHDEQILFSAINHVAGKELRLEEYVHFWTFCGYFNEIGEGVFSNVVNIRAKRNKGKKLESYEKEFYYKNKEMIDLPIKYSKEEQEEIEKLLSIF